MRICATANEFLVMRRQIRRADNRCLQAMDFVIVLQACYRCLRQPQRNASDSARSAMQRLICRNIGTGLNPSLNHTRVCNVYVYMYAMTCNCSGQMRRMPSAGTARFASRTSNIRTQTSLSQGTYRRFACTYTRCAPTIDVPAHGLTRAASECTYSGLEFNLHRALAFVRNSLYRTRRFHGLRAQAALLTHASNANSRNRECGIGGSKGGVPRGGHSQAENLGYNRTANAHRRNDSRYGYATTKELGGTT